MSNEKEPFRSALELSTLADYTGDICAVRKSIEEQLSKQGIDYSVAVKDLPKGKNANVEAVVRLISLARGHGLYVTLKPQVTAEGEGLSIGISAPNRDVGQLQSGHH